MFESMARLGDRLLGRLVPRVTASAACTNCFGCWEQGCGCQGNNRWAYRYCWQCQSGGCIAVFSTCVSSSNCL
ncbi:MULTISPECIES: hypothetical protein [Microbispora]|uniref:Uncharacterized protein n=3 Tax=Microbispora TaxID=2005 RepID=A0ABY3LYF2_9ACTN|nr:MULTISPECIES: hypothetical protein [Microbispora]RGA02202.1 hypothetical protein DI270_025545 [Microbispora triticiradicis]TLP55161.1 hypothetical protein FED44_25885 [Microbispora fusca]TYB59687.1 hypothetical protein FXF59_14770 [Microbispora tritici]GLW22398.1 hypothetical protein Mame01_24410 [Microbispora amethystogenes]